MTSQTTCSYVCRLQHEGLPHPVAGPAPMNERAVTVVALALHDAACFMGDNCRTRLQHAYLQTPKARRLLADVATELKGDPE